MITRIRRWGTSLALRIPKALAREAGLQEGALVEVSARRRKVILAPTEGPPLTLDQLLEGVTEENRHHEVSTGLPSGQEAW